MMRALWTAASGMTAQQLNVDVISNNLSNVNTTGYKKQRVEFKDLLYETLSRANVLEGEGRPVNLQVGHGVAPVSTVTAYTMGNLEKTDNPLDFAIDGEGFFAVRDANEQIAYTRDGSFKISISDGEAKLVTKEGYAVLDDGDNEIYLTGIDVNSLSVGPTGELTYIDEDDVVQSLGQTLQVVQFQNRDGLLKTGSNFVSPSSASGEPILEMDIENKSTLMQGFLESSNVQVVEEMVKLIVAQRAYEVNSKAIQTSDEMLQMANNLRR
ncbi:flagellar basal-body rod protein FlgG [Petroclostridium sp. X23]|uniref:flagellar basal-body rod protein FlgG n=1 Tax=Petroclostridium sp. X23 TaxID=3045146 RepID=UPI0024AD2D68|nr:flagellar basal-body rod protein FlgG [Petroclostridium sp. X23]WHH57595.1 flagellar basal-body rod protein FlgG [Petroclostridium sp. X23]